MIKILVCDVDGTLTDGAIIYGSTVNEIKAFSVKDGLILKPLPQLGIQIVFLTGRKSEAVERRAFDFGATAIQGIDNKPSSLCKLLEERNIDPKDCAFIGDDLNDYAAMKLCGFKACPSDAVKEIKEIADYVSAKKGGHGAVRDICEYILKHNGKYDELLAFYGVIR